MMISNTLRNDSDLTMYGIVALCCALGIVLCLRAMIRLHPKQRGDHGERGVATIEFALVMPVVLFLILILAQTAVLMASQFFVHYASFAATRVAIVQIPRDLSPVGGEEHNVISPRRGSPKFDAITRAAQIAVMPVSGRDESSDVDELAFAAALESHFTELGKTTPRWVQTLAGERMAYAVEHTEIELLIDSGVDDGEDLEPILWSHTYEPRETVIVNVAHRLNLAVPYVRAIFADGYHQTLHGETAYAEVSATSALPLAGVDPALPVEPSLPRRDKNQPSEL